LLQFILVALITAVHVVSNEYPCIHDANPLLIKKFLKLVSGMKAYCAFAEL